MRARVDEVVNCRVSVAIDIYRRFAVSGEIFMPASKAMPAIISAVALAEGSIAFILATVLFVTWWSMHPRGDGYLSRNFKFVRA